MFWGLFRMAKCGDYGIIYDCTYWLKNLMLMAVVKLTDV